MGSALSIMQAWRLHVTFCNKYLSIAIVMAGFLAMTGTSISSSTAAIEEGCPLQTFTVSGRIAIAYCYDTLMWEGDVAEPLNEKRKNSSTTLGDWRDTENPPASTSPELWIK